MFKIKEYLELDYQDQSIGFGLEESQEGFIDVKFGIEANQVRTESLGGQKFRLCKLRPEAAPIGELVWNVIDNPAIAPYKSVVKLACPDENHAGTAFRIGPNHFITAAHNVLLGDDSQWAHMPELRVISGAEELVHTIKIAKVFVPESYNTGMDKNSDYAIIITDHIDGFQQDFILSTKTNLSGLSGRTLNVLGYPEVDFQYQNISGDVMIHSSGVLRVFNNEQLATVLDTMSGHSGGPLYLDSNNNRVIGICTTEPGCVDAQMNYGSLLFEDTLISIIQILNSHFV